MNQPTGERVISDENSRAALWPVLTKIDGDLAMQACAEGCRCGGTLHRADYPRKVRGVYRAVSIKAKRDSFCCAEEGCRRRVTPGSVRFLGRRIYAGFIVVLLTALRHGLSADRVQVLREQLGVEQRTLERWREWWLQQFASGRPWRLARARFMPLLDEATLPWSLWTRFCAHGSTPLVALLRFLTPWSIPVAPAN